MNVNYRQQVTFTGMLIGAMLGAVGATLWLQYLSSSDQVAKTKATTLGFGDMARIVTATLALLRQVNELTTVQDEPVQE